MEKKQSKIVEYRKKAGMTQKEMSEYFGIPKRTIENWEGGKSTCPVWGEKLLIEKLELIAEGKKLLAKDRFIGKDT